MATYNTIIKEEEKVTAAPAQTQQQVQQTSQQNTTAAKAPSYTDSTGKYTYNAANNAAYQQAWSALESAKKNMPTYANSYEAQIKDLYNQITNRDKFSYNVNEDALYRQYRDQYAQMGQLAMKDTMGQAAALTGGYGSSYGQSVGQQQYNAYLQQLNDVVPELYGMAYQRYQDEGNAMQQQYGMLGDLAADEYGKYQDSLNNYYTQLNYLQGQADDAYNKGYDTWYDSLNMQKDAYDQLVDLITNIGYNPSAEELAEAGMSASQAAAYKAFYDKNNPVVSASSGGPYTGGKKTLLDEAKEALNQGASMDEVSAAIKSLAGSNAEYSDVGVKATDYALNNNLLSKNSAASADNERYEIMNLKKKK